MGLFGGGNSKTSSTTRASETGQQTQDDSFASALSNITIGSGKHSHNNSLEVNYSPTDHGAINTAGNMVDDVINGALSFLDVNSRVASDSILAAENVAGDALGVAEYIAGDSIALAGDALELGEVYAGYNYATSSDAVAAVNDIATGAIGTVEAVAGSLFGDSIAFASDIFSGVTGVLSDVADNRTVEQLEFLGLVNDFGTNAQVTAANFAQQAEDFYINGLDQLADVKQTAAQSETATTNKLLVGAVVAVVVLPVVLNLFKRG